MRAGWIEPSVLHHATAAPRFRVPLSIRQMAIRPR